MYKYYNANTKKRIVNDCVIRSISVAEHLSWDEAYCKLSRLAQKEGTLLDDMSFVEKYLNKKYKRVCYKSKTLYDFMSEHPHGRYLVTMNGHITAVIDGTLYDTFDCRKRTIWCAWRIK